MLILDKTLKAMKLKNRFEKCFVKNEHCEEDSSNRISPKIFMS